MLALVMEVGFQSCNPVLSHSEWLRTGKPYRASTEAVGMRNTQVPHRLQSGCSLRGLRLLKKITCQFQHKLDRRSVWRPRRTRRLLYEVLYKRALYTTTIVATIKRQPGHRWHTLYNCDLEFPTPCKAHHVFRINGRSDFAEPFHIPTIHVLQWRAKKRIVRIFRCMRHILPIRESSSVNRVGNIA